MIEFAHFPDNTFTGHEYIIEKNEWYILDKADANMIERAFLQLSADSRIRSYFSTLFKRHITSHLELVRHAIWHFFPKINHIDDIADDGTINIETNK